MSSTKDWVDSLPAAFINHQAGRRLYEVECMVPDMAGISRGKAMPAGKFAPDMRTFLPSSIFYQTITGGYADLEILDQWTEVDLVLVPDMSTACAVPWADDLALQIIHDVEETVSLDLRYYDSNFDKPKIVLSLTAAIDAFSAFAD